MSKRLYRLPRPSWATRSRPSWATKEEQKEAVRAFVAGNDVFVAHDGHNPASVQQSPLVVIRICNSTDSASVLGAAGHLNTAVLATL